MYLTSDLAGLVQGQRPWKQTGSPDAAISWICKLDASEIHTLQVILEGGKNASWWIAKVRGSTRGKKSITIQSDTATLQLLCASNSLFGSPCLSSTPLSVLLKVTLGVVA